MNRFIVPKKRIVLASASPRRKELLEGAGLSFEIIVSNCDEAVLPNETAEEMVKRLSFDKASDVFKRNKDAVVIGADTTVVLDGEILGKPSDTNDAFRMYKSLQGRSHTVWGGFTIIGHDREKSITKTSSSEVTIVPVSDSLIRRYIETGEPMDKAGSYAIQGIGSQFIANVKGSYSNVVGLDLSYVMQELRSHGVIE